MEYAQKFQMQAYFLAHKNEGEEGKKVILNMGMNSMT